MEKHVHIVCFDVPYPVDYGGVFDLFYKIKTLYELGIGIHLHCFEYGRGYPAELKKYCIEVNYYDRNEGHKGFSTTVPYIVASRSSELLSEKLEVDNYPVILEGIHCTYPLFSGALTNRKVYLRLMNVESQYYHNLFRWEKNWLKKAYYFNECRLLKCYEQFIADKASVLPLSRKDLLTYKKTYGVKQITYLPAFIPYQEVKSKTGTGMYCLYHGNLSVNENEKAAIWLLENIFNRITIPFVIAGKNPSGRLQRIANLHSHTCLITNPDEAEMKDLITKAQIHILPSFNDTGVKLKLLNALFNGRHCVVNEAAVKDSIMERLCHIGSNAQAMRQMVMKLYQDPFKEDDIEWRKKLLCKHFNNLNNAQQLIEWLW